MTGNLEQYRIFYAVGREGSLTKAAASLCISQPAVSQGLKNLERSLGCSLFRRTSKGVQFTREGEALFRYVEQGFSLLERGELDLRSRLLMEDGEIRIGASDMTLQFYLLPYLERFHLAYPHIKIQVTNAPTPETLQSLEEGRIDFGVVSTPVDAGSHLQVKKVREIQDIFIGGPRFLQLKNSTLSYDVLHQYPLICLQKDTSTRRFMDHYMLSHQIALQPEFELATSDMIVQFVCRNMGIGHVVREFALPYLKKGQVFELFFGEKIPSRFFCLVTSRADPMSRAGERFMELIPQMTEDKHN